MADAGALKQLNLHLIRGCLASGEAMSKTGLAAATGLSFPTVSRTVDTLVESGELIDQGVQPSTGGRAAKLYAPNPTFHKFLLLRLEGKTLYWSLRDRFGAQLDRGMRMCTAPYIDQIATLVQREQARHPQLRAVAFGIAAYVHHGLVRDAALYPELRGVNLQDELYHRCGLPIVVENDMPSATLGHWSQYYAETGGSLSCIYLGESGFGSATVLGGIPLRGHDSFAGEIYYLPQLQRLRMCGQLNYRRMDMAAFYVELIQSIAVWIAPDRIVLYDNEFLKGQSEPIAALCHAALPAANVPELVVCTSFEQDYEHGLMELARRLCEEQGGIHEVSPHCI